MLVRFRYSTTGSARRLTLAAWLGLGSVGATLACATVTQEDPPSLQTGGSQGGGGGSSGLGGAAGGGGASNGGTNNTGVGGSSGFGGATTNGGTGGSVSGGGSSQGGTGGSTPGVTPPLSVDAGRPPGTVLLEEDFESFVVSDWTTTGGTWALGTDPGASGNVYTQTDNTNSEPYLTALDGQFDDFIAQVDFKVVAFNGGSSSYMAGICVRVADAGNFYMVGLRSNNGSPLQLRRFGGDNEGILADSNVDQAVGTWYRLRVDVTGSTIAAYLNGELMFSQTDSGLTIGGVALCAVRASIMYDNFIVTDPG